MDDRLFRTAMGKFATGITVVTNKQGEEIHGMTVNAFMSVSLNPKLIVVSIDEKVSMYEELQKTKHFGVSILSEQQKDMSMVFAKQIEKDQEITYDYINSVPVLKNSLASLACKVHDKVKAGDHLLLIGEVIDLKMNEENNPIIYFSSKYREIK